jgi:hypothetical protein
MSMAHKRNVRPFGDAMPSEQSRISNGMPAQGFARQQHEGVDSEVIVAAHVPDLLRFARAEIERLQDELIRRMTGGDDSEDARRRAAFELYNDGILHAGDVRRIAGLNHWEFQDFLDEHPEYAR